MNGNYYQNPVFPNQQNVTPNQQVNPNTMPYIQQPSDIGKTVPTEQSYIENVLRLNKGKLATFYMSFTDSTEWKNKVFTGIVEQAGRDHIIISDPQTGIWYLLLMLYLDYVTFDEKINFITNFQTA